MAISETMESVLPSRKYTWVLILGIIFFAIPLIGFTINGLSMRYIGDDYCYGAVLTRFGFWKAQWSSYFQPQAYNGNRYSLTFFSDLSGLLGPRMNSFLPGLVIIMWLAGMMYTLRQAFLMSGVSVSRWEKLLIAVALAFFTLYTAPNLPQILYWRSGMLPYFAPVIANTYLIGLIIKQVRNNNLNYLEIGTMIILSIIAGGFSETTTSVQIGYLFLWLIAILLAKRWKNEKTSRAAIIVGAALVSSIVTFLILAISPSNADRLMQTSHPDFLDFASSSLRFAWAFVVESLKGLPLPTILLLFFSTIISWIILSRTSRNIKTTNIQYFVSVLMILLGCFYLIVWSVAPSAYAQSAYPTSRALIAARFIMILSITALGSLAGLMIHQLLQTYSIKPMFYHSGILLIMGILYIYPIYASRNIYDDLPKYQRWATFWDRRDQEIRAATQKNVMNVEVVNIDHIIPQVGDLSADPGYWYNGCAAGYYGVGSISANQPGWDAHLP